MRKELEAVKPRITLYANESISDTRLLNVLLGIEEEGVPVEVIKMAEPNPLVLAHEASLASPLGIGIGVSLNYIVVTGEKLSADRPYLASEFNRNRDSDRAVGGNAARIVKRMPLHS